MKQLSLVCLPLALAAACGAPDPAGLEPADGKADVAAVPVCDEAEPLGFEAQDSSALDAMLTELNATCGNPVDWCSVARVEVYATPACANDSLQAVVDPVLSLGRQPTEYFQWGTSIPAAELASRRPLSGSDSADLLLDSIAALAAEGEEAQVWVGTFEVPCHNCTESETFAVLSYPESDLVVVIRGTFGFDS